MKISRLIFFAIVALAFGPTPLLHAGEKWKVWPEGSGGINPGAAIPPGFEIIPSLVPVTEDTLVDIRVRSADGQVEFAVAARNARMMPPTVDERLIEIPLEEGERIVKRDTLSKIIESDYRDYTHHSEDIVVQGPEGAYTRYFRIEVSTGRLAGASTVLWEFKVKDEEARQHYQEIYRRFKDMVNLGEF